MQPSTASTDTSCSGEYPRRGPCIQDGWIDYNCHRALRNVMVAPVRSLSCSFIANEYPSLRMITS